MSSQAHADPRVIEGLRQSLRAIRESQSRGLDGVLLELTRTLLELERTRELCEREVGRCQQALSACQAEQVRAAQDGGYIDCSGMLWALQEAQMRLDRVIQAIGDVEAAGERFRRLEQRHRSSMIQMVDAMDTGLLARATSLEQYLSWTIGAAPASVHPEVRSSPAPSLPSLDAMVADREIKMKYESITLPSPPEDPEGRKGGVERLP